MNVATVTGQDPDGNDVTDTSDDPTDPTDVDPNNDGDPDDPTVTDLSNPMLSLSKVFASFEDVNGNGVNDAGDIIHYNLTVENTGNVDLTNVMVTDPGATVIGGPIALLAVGVVDSTTFTATYVITNADIVLGTYTNVATATGTDPDGNDVSDISDDPNDPTDIDPNNDGDPDDPTIVVINPISDLELTKVVTDGNYTPSVGDEISFDITVSNNGPSVATGVIVHDMLPSGFTYVDHAVSSGIYDPVTGDWNDLDEIPVGTSVTLNITVLVNAAGGYTNVAEVMFANESDNDSPHGNGVLAEDDMDDAVVNPISVIADLSLVKTISDGNTVPYVGDEMTFDIQVINDGPQTATGVSVMELLESGYTYINHSASSGNYNYLTGLWSNLDDIPAGTSQVLTITVLVNPTGDYTNTAEVLTSDQDDSDSTPGNGDLTEDDMDTIINITPIQVIDLEVVKTASDLEPEMTTIETEITFTIEVTNKGPNDATEVVVTDLLPNGFEYLSATTSEGVYDEVTGLWTIGTIENGDTETLTVTVNVLPTGNWTNVAELTAVNPNQFDIDSAPGNGVVSEDDYSFVKVEPILTIPDAFSPNDDGLNDTWIIPGLDQYPNFELEIYDRWGNIVYHYENKNVSIPTWWDGTSNGRMNFQEGESLPAGTYFYLLKYNKGNLQPITGYIFLNR